MSVKDEYSYWLSIETADRRDLTEAERLGLEDIGKSYDNVSFTPVPDCRPHEVCFEVDPDLGTCQEDESLEETLRHWSRKLGDGFVVLCHAIDEDDKSKERHWVFRNGVAVRDAYSRLVPADSNWDGHTLDDVIGFIHGYLGDAGDALVDAIRERFAEPDWDKVDWDAYVDRNPAE